MLKKSVHVLASSIYAHMDIYLHACMFTLAFVYVSMYEFARYIHI